MSKYSEEIYKEYHDQVESINECIINNGKVRLAEELVIDLLIAIDEVNQKNNDVAPLLKKGNWLTRLFTIGENIPIEWYIVGNYTTAQEAYYAANAYVENNQALFKEQSKGKVPDHLSIELVTTGTYPESVEEQFIFDFFPSSDGAYIDSHGVTRASYLINQKV